MRISIDQSGGYAGGTSRIADVDSAKLDQQAAQELGQIAARIDSYLGSGVGPPPLGADLLTYTITISDARGGRSLRFTDDGGPEIAPLRDLVNTLTQRFGGAV